MAATDQQITDRRISVVGSGQTLPVPAAGLASCMPNSTAAISTSKRSGLRGKRQADSGQASELGRFLFGGFTSAAPAPPLTGNTLFGSKPASDAAPTYNASSTSGAGRVSKSSQCLIPLEV